METNTKSPVSNPRRTRRTYNTHTKKTGVHTKIHRPHPKTKPSFARFKNTEKNLKSWYSVD